MKNTLIKVSLLSTSLLLGSIIKAQDFSMQKISTYETGVFDESAAEISTYDPESKQLYFVNGDNVSIDILNLSNPESPTLVTSIDIRTYGGGVNSVDFNNGILAAAVENSNKQLTGFIVLFDANGNHIKTLNAGALPDMVTFNNAGTKIISANEGEPNDDYTIDPEGSITVVDMSSGAANATSSQISLDSYNDKKYSLLNKGIRIFGPNATVAQDLEPEYIAMAKNDSIAYVSCQENNAIAIVNINSLEVLDILPFGYKDHSKGTPILSEYLLNDFVPSLGSPLYGGNEIKVSGFSGLFFSEQESNTTSLVFYTIPDRGPNESTVAKAATGTSQNLRPFKIPDYQARIVKFTVNRQSGRIILNEDDQIFLTQQDGTTPISGRGNIEGFDEVPVTQVDESVYTQVDYTVDGVEYQALDYDLFGGDFEGILIDKNGDFWMCDEYRPGIYKFNPSGTLIERYVPEGTSLLGETAMPVGTYGSETLPSVYSKRRANRGFEAIAYDSENDIIYAFIQSPMYNRDNGTQNKSDVIRVLGINANTGLPVSEYVYLLERNKDAGLSLGRVDKIGDAVYTGKGKFKIMERDSSLPGQKQGKKYVFEIDLKGATNILNTPISLRDGTTEDLTLEEMSADQIEAAGIKTIWKNKVLNLPSIGYLPSDKPEGIAQLPDGSIVVLNDNDFGIAGAGVSDDISLGIISFETNYAYDASDRDGGIYIENRPTLGMYMPDAITTINYEGLDYIITANEGDSRDYDGYSEEERIKDFVLDADVFDPSFLQADEQLGRLKTSTAFGDLDGDNDMDVLYSLGARSFSIFDQYANIVYDSGDDFEQYFKNNDPEHFNFSNDSNDDFENRSDDKGTEPEALTVGVINDVVYAFIGLERVGGIMVYNITNPLKPEFVYYINNRNFDVDAETSEAGDLGVEGLLFIPESESPNGKNLIIASNEVSGTVTLFNVFDGTEATVGLNTKKTSNTNWTVYPNPSSSGILNTSITDDFDIYNTLGQKVMSVLETNKINVSSLKTGAYILKSSNQSAQLISIE